MDALIPEDRLARAEKWSETLLVDGAPHQKEIANDVASLCKHVRDRDGGHLGSISGLQQTFARVQARNDELEAESAELKAKIAELQNQINTGGVDGATDNAEITELREKLADSETMVVDLRSNYDRMATEKREAAQESERKLGELQGQLEDANAENAQLKQDLAKALEPKTGSQGGANTGTTSGTEQTG